MANAQSPTSTEKATLDTVKAYLTPVLALILWTILYSDMQSLKQDVKELMQYKIILQRMSGKEMGHNTTLYTPLYFKPEEEYRVDRFVRTDIPTT